MKVAMALWLLCGIPANAETCTPIVERVAYCAEVEPKRSGYAQAVYPDLVATYNLQDRPLVTAVLVVMPYETANPTPDDQVRMMLDQLMRRGTPPVASIPGVEVDTYLGFGGKHIDRVTFSGRHKDGGLMGRFAVDIVPMPDELVLLYTESGGFNPVDPETLMQLHQASVKNLKVEP
jgi:hypothetical protein